MAQASLFRKLGLLIYKNLLLRMRQWVVTIFEVFFSLILGGLFVFVVLRFGGGGGSSKEPENIPSSYMTGFGQVRVGHSYCTDTEKFLLAYAPSTSDTDTLMKSVTQNICSQEKMQLETMGNAKELEDKYYSKWIGNPNFKGAIIFKDGIQGDSIEFTLRVPSDCLPSTNHLFPPPGSRDFNKIGPNSNGINKYKKCGVLSLQWIVQEELTKRIMQSSTLSPSIQIATMPYPAFKEPIRSGSFYLPAAMVLCFFVMWSTCFLLVSITRNVVTEKQTGVAELLRLSGVPGWLQWISWLIHMFLPHIITIFGLTLMTSGLTYRYRLPLLGANVMLVVFIFVLFLVHNIALGFMICAVFKKPIIASTVAVFFSIGTAAFGLYYGMFSGYKSLSYAVRVIAAIFSPNFALAAHFVNMVYLDKSAVDESDTAPGATWSNLGEYHYIGSENVSMGALILIQLLTSIIFMLLAAYLDAVLPSEYGVRKPWHYFQCARGKRQTSVAPESTAAAAPSLTSGEAQVTESAEAVAEEPPQISDSKLEKASVKSSKRKKEDTETSVVSLLPSSFEPVSEEGRTVGVEICNLIKKFGHKTAVNGVSFKMYTGDIFALLGHNGAGKTTLISMLTGFFSPTAGTAYVDGYDIRDSLEKARESMGLCPQHNMLFDKLTVKQQLMFFGMLRGLKKAQAQQETQMLLGAMKFTDKANVTAKKLSGGQKRKLSLGIALIGGTKVVVLDEPTSGMDPQARREIWDLLLQLRGQRSILLTTHFMEEADVLGDRIGIMAAGQLQCTGSASFLKKFYGTGYTLKLTLNEPSHVPSKQPSAIQQQQQEETGGQSVAPSQSAFKMEPSAKCVAILSAVQKHVPNANFKAETRTDLGSNELSINLPGDTATTQILSQMFSTLTSQQEKLGIRTMGISQTTMDEVFLRVGEMAEASSPHAPQVEAEEEVIEKAQKSESRFIGQFLSLFMKKALYAFYRWMSLLFLVHCSILTKISMRFTNTKPKTYASFQKVLLLLGIFILVLLQVNALLKPSGAAYEPPPRSRGRSSRTSSSGGGHRGTSHRSLTYTLDVYDSPITLYTGNNAKEVIGKSARESSEIDGDLLNMGNSGRIAYKTKYVVALDENTHMITAKFNQHPYHSAPLALNLAFNTFLAMHGKRQRFKVNQQPFDGNAWVPGKKDVSLGRSGQMEDNSGSRSQSVPLRSPHNSSSTTSNATGNKNVTKSSTATGRPVARGAIDDPYYTQCFRQGINNWGMVSFLVQLTLPLGLIIFLSYFVVQPIDENLCKVKQLQTMTGVNPLLYWGGAFAFDFALYLITVLILLVVLVVVDAGIGHNALTANGGWFVFLVILLTYGCTAIFFCYLVSLRSGSIVGGFTLVALIQLFGGFLLALTADPHTLYTADEGVARGLLTFFYYFGRLFPSCAMSRALWYWAEVSAANTQCRFSGPPPGGVCPPPLPYWVWSTERTIATYRDPWRGGTFGDVVEDCRQEQYAPVGEGDPESGYNPGGERTLVDKSQVQTPGIVQELFFIVFYALVYLAWLLLVEFKVFRMCFRKATQGQMGVFPPNINDQDVWEESNRVDYLIGNKMVGEEALLVQKLCKSFGDFAAVSNLQFGVHYGECFGMLGVNGAGKTTAFRMITGDELPTAGTVFGFDTSLDKNTNKFLSNIGYCPQFDAIFNDFTGTEMLQLFAGLRGVPFRQRKKQAMLWLARMGLTDSARAKCGRYSGGMKRRLSTAMAMVGDPLVILLDEPTSGVDPVSRRQFWKILDKLKASGQSIILTSHSMEECEALCARLGIMVNGQFQCFGPVQHLKSKFAQGYSMTLKLKPDLAFDTPEIDEKINVLLQKIWDKFQPCELKDRHQNMMQFHLQDPSITWDVLFKKMEEVRSEFEELIEDYNVNETSLEEVFLAFARGQYPERKMNPSMCARICTCRC